MPRPWLAWICLIVLAAAGLGSRPATGKPPSTPLTPAEVQAVAELAMLRVPVQQLVTSRIEGRTGGIGVLLAARGEAVIGVDLSSADLALDAKTRTVTVTLPPPSVLQVTLDHAATSVVHVARHGLWLAMPGSAGEGTVLQQAFSNAQVQLAAHAGTAAHLQVAREHTAQVLGDLVTARGWTLHVQWR